MRYIPYSLLLGFCILIPPAHAARPTLRVLRSGAYNIEKVRRAMYSQKAEQYKTFQNEALGFSVEYPEEWDWSYVTAKSLAEEIVHFAPTRNVKSALSVWVKKKEKQLTYEDLEKDFVRFARQPKNDYQLETMSFIHELELLEQGHSDWKGKSVHRSVFSAGGIQNSHEYIQVRISDGERLFVLSLASPPKNIEKEKFRLDALLSSFRIFPVQQIQRIKPSRAERRSRLHKSTQIRTGSSMKSRADIRRERRMRKAK
jgi:hypothetical protein